MQYPQLVGVASLDITRIFFISCTPLVAMAPTSLVMTIIRAFSNYQDNFTFLDALDGSLNHEWPSITGTPSARKEVLNFVEDLVWPRQTILLPCVTSRPKHTVLNLLASTGQRVLLHKEHRQNCMRSVKVNSCTGYRLYL